MKKIVFTIFALMAATTLGFSQSATLNAYQWPGVGTNLPTLTVQPVVTITGTLPSGSYVLQGWWEDSEGDYTTGTAALCTTVFGQTGNSSVTVTGTGYTQLLSTFVDDVTGGNFPWRELTNHNGNVTASNIWTFHAVSLTSSSGTFSATGSFAITHVYNFVSSGPPAATVGGTQTMNITVAGTGTAPLPVQPLNLGIVNRDATGTELEIFDPNKSQVFTFGVGGTQSASTSFTPSGTPPVAGVYYFGYVKNGVVQNIDTATLTLTPTGPTWSATWTGSGTLSMTINSGPSGNTGGTNGSYFTNNSGSSVMLNWLDPSGAVLGSVTIPNGSTSPLTVPTITLPNGSTETLSLVNASTGSQVGQMQVYGNSLDGNNPVPSAGKIGVTLNPAPGTTTQTGTQTNAGNSPTGPDTSPTTAVNNGNTSISGGTNGATNQDIYNDVKQAMQDAQANTDSQIPSFDPTLPSDAVYTDLSGHTSDENSLIASGSIMAVTSGSNMNPLPFSPTIGSPITSFAVPSMGMLPAWNIDYSSYSSAMSLFRALCLIAVNIVFIIANRKTATSLAA